MDNKSELLELMRNGATVITPNNRLSQALLKDFFKTQSALVQIKPFCLPYSAFLQLGFKQSCHQNSQRTHPLLLNTQQQHHLWRTIILKFRAQEEINEGLLTAVEEAWLRCHLWELDLEAPAFSYTMQTVQFQHWALQFKQALKSMGAITESELVSYLVKQETFWALSNTIIWACFDDYTPQQRTLQNYFKEQFCQQFHYDLAAQETSIHHYAASDEQEEYLQLIAWLKEQLSKNKKAIAVVVPDLETNSHALQRLLAQHLPLGVFNVSLGQPLIDYPLVAHALTWLQLDNQILNLSQAQLLLDSPYLQFSKTEMLARAEFREQATLLQEAQFKLADFLQHLEPLAPLLAKTLKNMPSYPQQALVKEWIIEFKKRLNLLGFPGEYLLNSYNYQCYQRFLEIFDEFNQLALISPSMEKEQALQALSALLKKSIFQPKQGKSLIHILGLLEASGCNFDSIWVTSLTDQCLPKTPKLSAFIPISLQREYKMPYADPLREFQLAEKTLTRLQNSSSQCIFSYPRWANDKPNMASPFIINLPFYMPPPLDSIPFQKQLEAYTERYQLPLQQSECLSGGTALLANQAKCPFRAFAAHRLDLKPSLPKVEGLDAKDRGQLIHKTMEFIWKKLQDQQTLLALGEEEIENILQEAIQAAFANYFVKKTAVSSLVQEVEFTRLKRLAYACLEWERQRPAFEIEALEQSFNIQLADLKLNIRVDRIDRLSDGKKWIIDYKTTFPSNLPWKEERPEEPQLLLYALLDDNINGILFAELKAGQFRCKGFSEASQTELGVHGLKKEENWADYQQIWQLQLTQLAEEFSAGHCHPQPKRATTCTNCDYQALCRLPFVNSSNSD